MPEDTENDNIRLTPKADTVTRKMNTHNSGAASVTGRSFFSISATRLSFSNSYDVFSSMNFGLRSIFHILAKQLPWTPSNNSLGFTGLLQVGRQIWLATPLGSHSGPALAAAWFRIGSGVVAPRERSSCQRQAATELILNPSLGFMIR
jgi:hypothetical protein